MIDQIRKALIDLGATPEAVAANLSAKGIKGNRISFCFCPVARYLTKEVGVKIGVDGDDAYQLGDDRHDSYYDEKLCVPLTRACVLFIRQFDTGEYPSLLDLS